MFIRGRLFLLMRTLFIKIMILLFFCFLFRVQETSAITENPTFDRYQVIIDRKPFGDPPPPPPPPPKPQKPPPPEQPSFAKQLRMSSIVKVEGGGVKVGLVDLKSNTSIILEVGDPPVEGIELVSADYAEEEAEIRKGDELALIKLDGGEPVKITANDQKARIEAAKARAKARRAQARRTRQSRRSRASRRRTAPPQPKYTNPTEVWDHLQEYNLEVIKKGLPPLPIPLTPEQDDQLVEEGYLPPVE